MSEFKCPRCHYTTNVKCNLHAHYKRKNPCKPEFDSTPIEELERRFSNTDWNFKCGTCGSAYASKSGIDRHMRAKNHAGLISRTVTDASSENATCTERHTADMTQADIIHMIASMREELSQIKAMMVAGGSSNQQMPTNTTNTTNNTTVNNTTNNTTVNLNMNLRNFGEENMDHITNEFVSQCLGKLNEGMLKLIQHIHFNPDVPENMNVLSLSRKKQKFAVVQNGVFVPIDSKTALNRMIHKGYTTMLPVYTTEEMAKDALGNGNFLMKWLTGICRQSSTPFYNIRQALNVVVENNTTDKPLVVGA